MSSDTVTPKLSILTDAALRAKAKMTSDTSNENEESTPKMNIKKFAIGIAAVTAGAVAVYGALKLVANGMAETEPEETNESEEI